MNNRRTVRRSGDRFTHDNKLQATCSRDDESVYAESSSSSGRGDSCGSSLSSCEDYLYSVDSCGGGGGHYEEVPGDWTLRLRLSAERHRHQCVYAKTASGEFIQARSHWTTSSLLCCASTFLAACSLSSLAACIVVTSFSLNGTWPGRAELPGAARGDFEGNDGTVRDAQIYGGTERRLQTPLTDYRLSHQTDTSTRSERPARYSWDCIAQAGLAKCRPVQKSRSRRENRHPTKLLALADGIYHVCVQLTGKVGLAPPTLLRAVIARVRPRYGTVNVTAVHTITGAADRSHSFLNGTFSAYSAAIVRLAGGDELLANVACVEQSACVVHINGTTSYMTLERLD